MKKFIEHINTSFDNDFEALRKRELLSWYPWVGKNYKPNDRKIMFILESAYENENNKGTILGADFTRQTIGEVFIDGAKYSNTLNKLRSFLGILIKDDTALKDSLWGNLVYHNVIQRTMNYVDKNREKPDEADFRKGCSTLKEVLGILKPSLCICMGVTLNRHIREAEVFKGLIRRDKTEPGKINEVFLLDLLTVELSGFKTKMIFTSHPANPKGFDSKLWAEYVQRHVPGEITQFRQC